MGYSIRLVTVHDAEPIVGLLNSIIEMGTFTIISGPISVSEQVVFIRQFPEQGIFHAAVCDDSDQLVGIQDVLPVSLDERALMHVGEIATFVALDFHRHGIGRQLCRATFRAAREKGIQKDHGPDPGR